MCLWIDTVVCVPGEDRWKKINKNPVFIQCLLVEEKTNQVSQLMNEWWMKYEVDNNPQQNPCSLLFGLIPDVFWSGVNLPKVVKIKGVRDFYFLNYFFQSFKTLPRGQEKCYP